MKVLVFAKHPQGGIRTYISYVYGNEVMQDLTFLLLTPEMGNRNGQPGVVCRKA
jgi:hypothetical protein